MSRRSRTPSLALDVMLRNLFTRYTYATPVDAISTGTQKRKHGPRLERCLGGQVRTALVTEKL